ncbi:hypothetical protein GCM10020331_049300 [Ectobacillus funiculus]
MTQYTKDDIVARARELAKMISETEEVDFFKRAEAKIHQNETIKQTISQIKALQKAGCEFAALWKDGSIEEGRS